MSANRTLVFEKNNLYHIYNRGCDKQKLFFRHGDYERFYDNIARFKKNCPHIEIYAWCLLPNHFHFLLLERDPDPTPDPDPKTAEQISVFMRKLQQAYAAYFSSRYKEGKGLVFEGKFKAKLADDSDYILQLKQYIEWNAVKHDIVRKPEEWEYSSYVPAIYGPDTYPNELEFNPYFE
jgi:putative transposase